GDRRREVEVELVVLRVPDRLLNSRGRLRVRELADHRVSGRGDKRDEGRGVLVVRHQDHVVLRVESQLVGSLHTTGVDGVGYRGGVEVDYFHAASCGVRVVADPQLS